MDSALELFALNGFQSTTMSMIARKSGISKGLIYNHFTSKDELLKAVILEWTNALEGFIDNVTKGETPKDKLKNLIEITFSPEMIGSDYWRFYFSLLMRPQILDRFQSRLSDTVGKVFIKFNGMLKDAGFSDPASEAMILAAILDGVALHYWMGGPDYPLKDVKRALIKRYCSS